jgi:hypothetical protein
MSNLHRHQLWPANCENADDPTRLLFEPQVLLIATERAAADIYLRLPQTPQAIRIRLNQEGNGA